MRDFNKDIEGRGEVIEVDLSIPQKSDFMYYNLGTFYIKISTSEISDCYKYQGQDIITPTTIQENRDEIYQNILDKLNKKDEPEPDQHMPIKLVPNFENIRMINTHHEDVPIIHIGSYDNEYSEPINELEKLKMQLLQEKETNRHILHMEKENEDIIKSNKMILNAKLQSEYFNIVSANKESISNAKTDIRNSAMSRELEKCKAKALKKVRADEKRLKKKEEKRRRKEDKKKIKKERKLSKKQKKQKKKNYARDVNDMYAADILENTCGTSNNKKSNMKVG